MTTPAWKTSRWKRLQVAAIAKLGAPLIAALGRTYRWRVEGLEQFDAIRAGGQQPILALWHGRILPGAVFWRHRGIVALASENFDGEWIARILEHFGFLTARGSTSRGARRALLQLTRQIQQGHPVAFTLDGPRGPACRAQPGALWLAKTTGHPLLPYHIESSRHWTARSWDRTQVPLPFSIVAVAIGAPRYIASDASDDELEAERLALEQSLEQLRARAHAMLA